MFLEKELRSEIDAFCNKIGVVIHQHCSTTTPEDKLLNSAYCLEVSSVEGWCYVLFPGDRMMKDYVMPYFLMKD